MNLAVTFRALGILVILFALTLLAPLVVSVLYDDGEQQTFLLSFLAIFIIGLIIWSSFYQAKGELKTRDGFLLTSLIWVVWTLLGAVPFLMASQYALDYSAAVFETASGLTSSGGTAYSGLDLMPKSLLYYRQQLQWIGGFGIVIVGVAILPLLGIGGMQLYRAEAGPIKDNKLTPRIKYTAYWLFSIYVAITVACALCFWLAGMTPFDAIAHSYSTVSLGGFSTHDASMGYYHSPLIWMIATVFMFIASLNFGLHFYTYSRLSLRHYLADSESIFYFFFLIIASIIIAVTLYAHNMNAQLDYIPYRAVFQAMATATTTGFALTDFSHWPAFLPTFLVLLSCVGACTGSTGGGIKAIRVLLIIKQGLHELQQLVHPNAVMPMKLKRRTIPLEALASVWSFMAVYIVTFLVVMLALQACGMDLPTSFGATASTLNNAGFGFGATASNYGDVTTASYWVMAASMLLGRLEIFTMLVIFTPTFWRR